VKRLLLVACLAAACGGEDDRPAVWSFIAPAIIQPNCATARCHSKWTSTAGLRFDAIDDSYTYLVGGGTAAGSQNFVVPFQPQDSKLMYLLRGEETRRMPPDQPLPDADIELIEAWILAGAPR
jgi:hypothetical protein